MIQSFVPPALVIELEFEAAPRLLIRADTEGDEIRVWEWISENDALCELVRHAFELAEQRPAA